jgi:hypothetical protein
MQDASLGLNCGHRLRHSAGRQVDSVASRGPCSLSYARAWSDKNALGRGASRRLLSALSDPCNLD